jgi:hypothetical protein
MNTETVLGQILPGVEALIKGLVTEIGETETAPRLYALEEGVQALLPRLGQLLLQGLVSAQGSGATGPERRCACGGQQQYRDQARPLRLQTSVGVVRVARRAWYRCGACGAHSYPLDERLGLKGAGRMSRYLQEQVAWLYSLLPAGPVQATVGRFGWPQVGLSQIREHAEALGAELEAREQAQQVVARQEAARPAAQHRPPRQSARGDRLYAGPDGVM